MHECGALREAASVVVTVKITATATLPLVEQLSLFLYTPVMLRAVAVSKDSGAVFSNVL